MSPEAAVAATAALRPDVLILTEARCNTFGKSLGISLQIAESKNNVGAGFSRPVECGVLATLGGFPLLGIWAFPRPTYGQGVLKTIEAYRESLGHDRAVVAGDFNSCANARNARDRREYARIIDVLDGECGLVSAYHRFFETAHGNERHPTYFHLKREHASYHIDYCFVPKSWTIRDVLVGAYRDWQHLSDHVPVIVDVTHV